MKYNLPDTWRFARIAKNVPDLREALEAEGFRLRDDHQVPELLPPYVVGNSDDLLSWEVAQGPAYD